MRRGIGGIERKRSSSTLGAGSLSGAPRKKKLSIKLRKPAPTLPAAFEEDTWRTLQAAVHAAATTRTKGAGA